MDLHDLIKWPWPSRSEITELRARIAVLEEGTARMATKDELQNKLNEVATAVDELATNLGADIDELERKAAEGVELDFTSLRNSLARLASVDARNPNAPTVPDEPETPAEPAPADPSTPTEPAPGEPVEPGTPGPDVPPVSGDPADPGSQPGVPAADAPPVERASDGDAAQTGSVER